MNFTSQLLTICFKNTAKEKQLLLMCKDVLCPFIKNSAVITEKKLLDTAGQILSLVTEY